MTLWQVLVTSPVGFHCTIELNKSFTNSGFHKFPETHRSLISEGPVQWYFKLKKMGACAFPNPLQNNVEYYGSKAAMSPTWAQAPSPRKLIAGPRSLLLFSLGLNLGTNIKIKALFYKVFAHS